LNRDQALKIVAMVKESCRNQDLNPPLIVGVFVNQTAARITDLVRDCQLGAVQLHGNETPSLVGELRQQLLELQGSSQTAVRIIRAIRLNGKDLPQTVDDQTANGPVSSDSSTKDSYLNGTISRGLLSRKVLAWKEVRVDSVLLDAYSAAVFGGSGVQLDWAKLGRTSFDLPWTLAGGLTPANVAEAIALSRTMSVDVASGVETAVGVKDELLMSQFVLATGWRAARRH
jgi:phosphoribosylanthranilate isomerase